MRTIDEAISEVDREKKVRERCYDRWVQDGKLSAVEAKDRLDRIASAILYLRDHKAVIENTPIMDVTAETTAHRASA